ncbi:hypothetical protein [Actinomycetospora cinnamomea]|uniref:hypothetical protein n=1 Tax=Actinomycetospora cinnamomea TaxID=663609 RepID=UPI000E32102E|nr:hypothetical protein [Actinomycetospora cinnamomea]
MLGSPATPSQRSAVRTLALVTSSLLVLLTAVGFDLLADERPLHTATVALAAAIVGVGRVWMQGRMRGVFAAVNLAVIGQPAVHALGKLTHVGDVVPHSHGWPQDFSGIALHVVVALLVVAISAGEPACAYLATAIVAHLVLPTRAPGAVETPSTTRCPRHDEPPGLVRQLLHSRSLSRRGPPLAPALAA